MLKTEKVQKYTHFTQKEAELLSGFTRDQLRTLDTSKLIVPYKHPSVLYTWNQIIFLRILFVLREEWSFYQIKTAINNSKVDMPQAIENIQNYIFVNLLLEKDEPLQFLFKASEPDTLYTQQMFVAETDSLLEHPVSLILSKKGSKTEGEVVVKRTKEYSYKITTVTIPLIINDLKVIAQENKIEKFDLKVDLQV